MIMAQEGKVLLSAAEQDHSTQTLADKKERSDSVLSFVAAQSRDSLKCHVTVNSR